MDVQTLRQKLILKLLQTGRPLPSKCSRNRGFTLIEFIVVSVVTGILTAVAVPVMLANLDRAKMAATVSSMRSFADGIFSFAVLNNGYPSDNHELVPAGVESYINGTEFLAETPLGGRYNFDNYEGGDDYIGISISSVSFSQEIREKLDSIVDGDVDLASGRFIDSSHSPVRPTLLIERCGDGEGLC